MSSTRSSISAAQLASMRDELEKIAMDPLATAGVVAAGKVALTNVLARHAHRIPPLRWLGKEVAGIGARTGMQGKPMLSRPMREVMSAVTAPSAVGLYEAAHGMGRTLGSHTPAAAQAIGHIGSHPALAQAPGIQSALGMAGGIPLESKGVRKVIDYGFTPVSQVARDVKQGVGKLFRRPVPQGATGYPPAP